jgi:hypothetical protein
MNVLISNTDIAARFNMECPFFKIAVFANIQPEMFLKILHAHKARRHWLFLFPIGQSE